MKRALALAALVATAAIAPRAEAGPISFLKRLFPADWAKTGNGRAKSVRPSRVHLLSPGMWGHLSDPAKANAYTLVHYAGAQGNGSGVIVGAWTGRRPGTLRTLVLTNRHVTEGNHADHALTLFDGTQVTRSKIVTSSRLLDYSLLEVELPDSAQLREAMPVNQIAPLDTKVYALGAATSMTTYPLKGFLAGGKAAHDRVEQDIKDGFHEAQVISSGKIIYDPHVQRVQGLRKLVQVHNAAGAPGSSGGPVFGGKDHQLIGLNASGYRDETAEESGMIPMAHIMYDLGKKLQRGRIGKASEDTVGDLLGRVYPQQ